MIYIVFDNAAPIGHLSKCVEIAGKSYENMVIKNNKLPRMLRQVILCIECAKKAKPGDTIICWFDFMAVLCWWFSPYKSKINFIAVNVLIKKKSSFKNLIFRMLYSRAFKSKNFKATITAKEYGDYLNNILNVHRSYTLLHDLYNEKHWVYKDVLPNIFPRSIFCGGVNGRDWDFILNLAKEMPDVTFIIAISKNILEKFNSFISSNQLKNIQLHCNVPHNEFAKLLCSSELIAMPLDSEAPSGLLVFFEATANKKMIITTDTSSTREYFSDGRGCLCKKDIQEWKNNIYYYLNNENERNLCNKKCNDFLNNECSQSKYEELLIQLILDTV